MVMIYCMKKKSMRKYILNATFHFYILKKNNWSLRSYKRLLNTRLKLVLIYWNKEKEALFASM